MKVVLKTITFIFLISMLFIQSACMNDFNPAPAPEPAQYEQKQVENSSVSEVPVEDPGAVNVKLMIGNDKEWIFKEVQSLLDQKNISVSGKRINILYDKAGTGEAMEKILAPESRYNGWMPASSTYLSLTNEKWKAAGDTNPRVSEEAITVFLTPTVIAMKESLAKKMGYPNKPIGWNDILALATAKDGWGIFGDSSSNPVRFAHTHPAKSNTGLNTLIAEEYAFSGKTKGLTLEDVAKNSDKLKTVEQTVVHYGESTSLLKDKMVAKGKQFIQFAVLYEYMVADMNSKAPDQEKTIAVYPKEGSLWADVVFTEVFSKGETDEQKKAIEEIKKVLISDEIQKKGMDEYYFRPANTQIPLSDAISAKYGIDPKEPKTLLDMPDTKICNAILDDWIKNMKKRANVTFVLDTSGSMQGEPIDNLIMAMNNIITRDNSSKDYLNIDVQDYVGIINFGSEVNYTEAIPGDRINEIQGNINSLEASGKTKLYDAIRTAIEKNSEAESKIKGKRINLVVVLTDGNDTGSTTTYDQLIEYIDAQKGELPTIMTIGYGDVNKDVLKTIASKTGGKYYDGTPDKILNIMKEIKTFF
jgi:Ca-activated chloride channel homolog